MSEFLIGIPDDDSPMTIIRPKRPNPRSLRYYDLQKNWRKVKRHIDKPEVQEVLVRDLHKFTWSRWRHKFELGDLPASVDPALYWRWNHRGRKPAYWDYVCCGACHWLVNFNLKLAQLVEPDRKWRIITSDKHSTVWDGMPKGGLLFEFNYLAGGTPASKCFVIAYQQELCPGELHKPGPTYFWRRDPAYLQKE